MVNIHEVATFRAPVQRVFALVADGAQARRWVTGVVSSERVGEVASAPVGVGARFRWVVKLGPLVREESSQQITLYRPNEEIGFRATSGLPVEGHWLFQHREGLTEVTYEATVGLEGRVLGRLLGSTVGTTLWASAMRASLGRLRGIVEAEESTSSQPAATP